MTSDELTPQVLRAQPLTQELYRLYGDVIAAREEIKTVPANMGTATRYNDLAILKNLRTKTAEANLCLFQCSPVVVHPQTQFQITLLEHHPKSTQVFVPMNADRYLVVVCLGGNHPDLSTLRVFLASGKQGITYHPGVWHHPLIAVDHPTQFACLVYEDGSEDDCTVEMLKTPVTVSIAT